MDLLQSDNFTVRDFFFEVWHSLLLKLQEYGTYTGNKLFICTYYGLQSELSLNSHFHINWPLFIVWALGQMLLPRLAGHSLLSGKYPWVQSSLHCAGAWGLSSTPHGIITDWRLLKALALILNSLRYWKDLAPSLSLPVTASNPNNDPFC